MTGEDIGINTLDPKVRLHINNGAVFVDSGGLNPNSTPLNSYYNTGNESSSQIILGNEWAWDSTQQSGLPSKIKARVMNYSGGGMRLSMNDGSRLYDHTSGQWLDITYDVDTYPSTDISLNRLETTSTGNSVILKSGIVTSSNYTGSLVTGDRMSLYADGSLVITGHLTVGDSDASGGTGYSQGSIRYNSLTNDFEGFTNQWESLTSIDVNTLSVSDFTTNLFLDRTLHNVTATGTTWTWGPPGSGATHEVPAFAGFKSNSTYTSQHKLTFYSAFNGYSELIISDLINIDPSNDTFADRLYLGWDDQEQMDDGQYVYFDGDDLWLVNHSGSFSGFSNTISKFYRVDIVR